MESEPRLLCDRTQAVLLVVDIQERLAAAMEEGARRRVIHRTGILLRAAGWLGIPRLLTEQYPKGLGPTVGSLLAALEGEVQRFEKTTFSCLGADGFEAALGRLHRPAVVIAGMEAHVCVLQTAVELAARQFQVFVVEDTTCSREAANHRNAMDRLRQAGVRVTNTESVLFEWLRDSRHERFKQIAALLR